MAAVPGEYAKPQGCLLVVEVDGGPMGGVGLRPLETGVPEIKRLYVRPGTRGLGFRRLLVVEIVARGRSRLPDAPPRYDPRIDGRCGAGVLRCRFR